MFTVEDFTHTIKEILGLDLVIGEDESIISTLKGYPSSYFFEKFSLPKEKLETLILDYNKIDPSDGRPVLVSENSVEILISYESIPTMSWSSSFFQANRLFRLEDKSNELIYEIGLPSDIFLLHTLKTFKKNNIYKKIRKYSQFFPMMDGNGKINPLNTAKTLIPKFQTIKVISKSEKGFSDLIELVRSCLFHFAYTQNIPITIANSFEEFYSYDKILRMKRISLKEMGPPQRIYDQSLISYYQLAISTDNPSLQYLSFYHIIEHFFDITIEEDLINTLKDKITKPDFSNSSEKDIKDIVRIVKEKHSKNSSKEKYALQLTLKKYFPNFNKVKTDLNSCDKDLINYYKRNEVSFSSGNMVNLDDTEFENIYSNLSERIYSTRNSIVHSKQGDKPKFIPFKDKIDLFKEIPLIRFIAEEIVFATSKSIL